MENLTQDQILLISDAIAFVTVVGGFYFIYRILVKTSKEIDKKYGDFKGAIEEEKEGE